MSPKGDQNRVSCRLLQSRLNVSVCKPRDLRRTQDSGIDHGLEVSTWPRCEPRAPLSRRARTHISRRSGNCLTVGSALGGSRPRSAGGQS
jgi:hypothetical protein